MPLDESEYSKGPQNRLSLTFWKIVMHENPMPPNFFERATA